MMSPNEQSSNNESLSNTHFSFFSDNFIAAGLLTLGLACLSFFTMLLLMWVGTQLFQKEVHSPLCSSKEHCLSETHHCFADVEASIAKSVQDKITDTKLLNRANPIGVKVYNLAFYNSTALQGHLEVSLNSSKSTKKKRRPCSLKFTRSVTADADNDCYLFSGMNTLHNAIDDCALFQEDNFRGTVGAAVAYTYFLATEAMDKRLIELKNNKGICWTFFKSILEKCYIFKKLQY